MEHEVEADLEALWQNVLERWDEHKAHDAFITTCYEREHLGFAASKYRPLVDDPDRGAAAERRVQSVAMLALQRLETERTTPQKKAPRWMVWVAAAVCAGAIGWFLYVLTV